MIGEKLKKQRELNNFSITELSKRSGVAKSYISSLERGKQDNPSLQFLSKMADSLNTTIEHLLFDEPDPILDKDWLNLINDAIKSGISKEDFKNFINKSISFKD